MISLSNNEILMLSSPFTKDEGERREGKEGWVFPL